MFFKKNDKPSRWNKHIKYTKKNKKEEDDGQGSGFIGTTIGMQAWKHKCSLSPNLKSGGRLEKPAMRRWHPLKSSESNMLFVPTPRVFTAAHNYLLLSIEVLDNVCYVPGI